MTIKPQAVIGIVLAIFVVGITVTSAFGLWNTTTTKIPAKISEGEYSGAYDPGDIRGSYSFADIAKLYEIPVKDLTEAFGVREQDAASFKCKDLESLYGETEYEIGTASVRMFAAFYLGLPYESTEEAYLTQSAADILSERGRMTEEQAADLGEHIVPAP